MWQKRYEIKGGERMIRWREKHEKLGRTPEEWLKEFGPNFKNPELADLWERQTGESVGPSVFRKARERYRVHLCKAAWDRHYEEQRKAQASVRPGYAGMPADKIIKAIKDKPSSIADLSRKFDRSEDTIEEVIKSLQADGYTIVEVEGGVEVVTKRELPKPVLTPLFDEVGAKFIFAHITDTHHGSIGAQITSFNRFVDEAYRLGVRHMLHSGDVTAGVDNYTEQNYELYAHGADEQKRCVLHDYPSKPGLKYYLIGGNHDFSYVKASGYNIVQAICGQRDDLVYAGFHMADIPLTEHISARLWHPIGGVPYASSYRLQKGVEQMVLEEYMKAVQQEENPTLRFVLAGHLHIKIWAGIGPIEGFHGGCFEGWTSYLKRKALAPNRGGWIIEVTLDKKDRIQRVRGEFIDFPEMEDDYKSWHIPHAEESEKTKISPLFIYQEGGKDAQ